VLGSSPMRKKSAIEIHGLEFDWLASDADGHVALFSTAGQGYAPPAFLQNTDAHDTAIAEILELAVTTSARFAPQLAPELQNTWKGVAERGLFAYDALQKGDRYCLVAAPEIPIISNDLPKVTRAVAVSITFRYLRFRELPEIAAELLKQ
jgi:hypothetical protein